MAVVVVAGSPGSLEFAVINFGNTPPTVVTTPGFQNGNVVDCYGTVAVVGENSGYSVSLFDISAPGSPVQTGTVETGFQIGSISTDGSYVLTGELNGSRVSLIDISNPASPFVVSVSDCAPSLDTITNVALRTPIAVVSGDDTAVVLDFGDPPGGAVASPIAYQATSMGPSDFDGETAAVVFFGGINTYVVSDNPRTATEIPYTEIAASVAVAEIPEGGYFVAVGGIGWFTLFAYPADYPMGSIKTSLQKGVSSDGTAVKFLNNPAIAPVLAVANVTGSGVFVSTYLIQVETGLPQAPPVISFFKPTPVAKVALTTTPTLGITAFTPRRRWPIPWPFPWPIPGWLEKILQALGL